MKVTQVSICPTAAATAAGAPALTPELLAATGARYSRNNEGLADILAKIDPNDLDKSVDSIFRMLDYGHQSIADMAPVAMFLDGVSQWLAYHVWSVCQAAGGQESSTRYIRMSTDSLIDAGSIGIEASLRGEWADLMSTCLDAYTESLRLWQSIADADPGIMRLPADLAEEASGKAHRRLERLTRNYGFDRARYYLPFAFATNLMLVMSARGWAQLCQNLCSHRLPEAQSLGAAIREQLALCAPRLMKHACEKASVREGLAGNFADLQANASQGLPAHLAPDAAVSEHPATAKLVVTPPAGATGDVFARDLEHHDNRYAWIGPQLRRTSVRFSWEAVALAEIRDLNRHRTGNRHCPLVPVGFYSALDQVPSSSDASNAWTGALLRLDAIGRAATARAHERLASGDPAYVYWLPMGAQCLFEHLTTADKFIYEAELRTGTGAHFRYARHLHDALALWYRQFPETQPFILEGRAEPE